MPLPPAQPSRLRLLTPPPKGVKKKPASEDILAALSTPGSHWTDERLQEFDFNATNPGLVKEPRHVVPPDVRRDHESTPFLSVLNHLATTPENKSWAAPLNYKSLSQAQVERNKKAAKDFGKSYFDDRYRYQEFNNAVAKTLLENEAIRQYLNKGQLNFNK